MSLLDEIKKKAETITVFGPVVQLAFHAPNIKKSAAHFSENLGAGPFYLFQHIPLAESYYRGAPTPFDHSSAYGQLGDIMIELIHQHNDAPSAVRDMYDEHTEGLHHAAVFPPSLEKALDIAKDNKFDVALDATTKDGVRFVMVDARKGYGHMIELYEESPALSKFYAFVKRKSAGWNGEDFLREL
jgi:hypothetical protein